MLIIGHRGAPSLEYENTVASFKVALNNNVDGLEFDVQYTKDYKLVIYHDFNISNNHQTLRISDLFFNDLQNFNKKYIIPTFEEVIQICPKNKLINIEIKSNNIYNDKIVLEIIQVLKKYNLSDNIVISSFNPFVLLAFKKQKSKIKIGLLWEKTKKQPWFVTHYSYYKLSPYSFHASIKFINHDMSNWVKDKGMKLFLYTVNNVKQREKAYELNADGIFSDYPNILDL